MPWATFTVPPPRSERMAAEELPVVETSRLVAFSVAPPVVIRPPELLPVVRMVELETLTVVPLPVLNTPLAWPPSVAMSASSRVSVAPSVASTAAFTPLKSALPALLEPVLVTVVWVRVTVSPCTSTAFSPSALES